MDRPVLFESMTDLDCFATRLLLAVLDVDFERVPVDVHPGWDQGSRDRSGLSSDRPLPLLHTSTGVLSGLLPVFEHLSTMYDPNRRFGRASCPAVRRWLDFATGEARAIHRVREEALFQMGPADAELAHAHRVLLIIEDELTLQALLDRPWIAGAEPSLADLALYPPTALMRDFGAELAEFPAIRQWLVRCRNLAPLVSMPGILDVR